MPYALPLYGKILIWKYSEPVLFPHIFQEAEDNAQEDLTTE